MDDSHKEGGRVLGTSRGPVDVGLAVESLIRHGVNMLFIIGGTTTSKGGCWTSELTKKPLQPLRSLSLKVRC